MTLSHYEKTSANLSKRLTISYSTSFSWGIKAFSKEYREPIYSIYGWVRVADEIVDTFHHTDKERLLKKFKYDTYEAIETGISTNPIIHAFQKVVNEYNIDTKLIDAFLFSMEMDLSESSYERKLYDEYVFGSAESVGLMCLKVFCKNDNLKYDELIYPAKMLGSAFQKVNFLRDINSDLNDRSRIYLPGIHHASQINDFNKQNLEKEIDKEFSESLIGITKLPIGVKLGVYSAYLYYLMLFRKIKKLDIKQLQKKRVRISNFHKFLLFLKSFWEVKFLKLT